MSEPRRLACVRITESLMKHPCASLFLRPVDPEKDKASEYFQIIKTPQDLSSIMKKLRDKQYPNIETFERDLVLIWYNAEKYNGRGSLPYILASSLEKYYQKLKKQHFIFNYRTWEQRAKNLTQKLDYLLYIAPSIAKPHFPVANPKKIQLLFREIDYLPLSKALQKLKGPQDTHAFVSIFRKMEKQVPIYEDPLIVDLRQLSQDTLVELRNYAKQRMKDLNLKYPE